MKIRTLIAALAAGLALAACGNGKERTIEFPYFESAAQASLDINKVQMTDSATFVTMHSHFTPGLWASISTDSYLQTEGKRYKLVSAEGIVPGERFVHPASGDTVFVLRFEPVPLSAKKMDFLESEKEGDFKIFGIDLTGKAKAPDHPVGIPQNLLTQNTDAAFPEVKFAAGTTKLKIHYGGYQKGLMNKAVIYVNDIFGDQKELSQPVDTVKGTADFSFDQYGPAVIFTNHGAIHCNPGETIEAYVDMTSEAREVIARRTKAEYVPAHVFYSGDLSVMNYLKDTCTFNQKLFEPYYMHSIDQSQKETVQKPDNKALIKMVLDEYDAANAKVEKTSRTALEKKSSVQKNAEAAIIGLLQTLDTKKLSSDEIKSIAGKIDFEDKSFLASDWSNYFSYGLIVFSQSLRNDKLSFKDLYPSGSGFADDLAATSRFWEMAGNGKMTDKDFATADSEISGQFFKDALKQVNSKALELIASAEKQKLITPTPAVSDDKVFDAIVSQYAGKVVLVDLWATWCGPCKAAIKANEPLKTGELKSDNLVWVYISAPSSVMGDYVEMIPDIKGVHYLFNQAQWDNLKKAKFPEIDGIPSYILVRKDGSYKLRNDLRDHELLVKEVKAALAE